jgi:hypothetical protein
MAESTIAEGQLEKHMNASPMNINVTAPAAPPEIHSTLNPQPFLVTHSNRSGGFSNR